MAVEQLFNQARSALKAGQRDEARKYLAAVLQADPNHIPAWLWMSEVLEEPERRRECLNRVLALDPENAVAKQGLSILDMKEIAEQAPPEPQQTRTANITKRLGEYLVEHRYITQQQLNAALAEQTQESRYGRSTPLGDILMRRRWLTVQGLTRVLDLQRQERAKEGLAAFTRLGDYLVRIGLITQTDLDQAIARQADLKRKGQNFQLGELLIMSGMVSKQQIDQAIAEQQQGYHSKLNRH